MTLLFSPIFLFSSHLFNTKQNSLFALKKKKRKKKGISLTQKKKISSSFKCHNSLSKSVIAYVWGWNFVIEWSVEWYYGDFLFSIIIILFYFIFPLFLISYFCQNFCFMLQENAFVASFMLCRCGVRWLVYWVFVAIWIRLMVVVCCGWVTICWCWWLRFVVGWWLLEYWTVMGRQRGVWWLGVGGFWCSIAWGVVIRV